MCIYISLKKTNTFLSIICLFVIFLRDRWRQDVSNFGSFLFFHPLIKNLVVYSGTFFLFVFMNTEYDFVLCIRAIVVHFPIDAEYQM